MSIMGQSDIDALLQEAGALASEADAALQAPEAPAPVAARPPLPLGKAPNLERVLRIRVPVIVQLAQRTMPIAGVRDLAVGSIIEFQKSVEEPLDLLVHNRAIGRGICVKVGENFGLRLMEICDRMQRIKSLGA